MICTAASSSVYNAISSCRLNVTRLFLLYFCVQCLTVLRTAALNALPMFLLCWNNDVRARILGAWASSMVTLRLSFVSALAIAVLSSSAKMMYSSMMASSHCVSLASFFLMALCNRRCLRFAALILNRLASVVGSSGVPGSAENAASLEYALLSLV